MLFNTLASTLLLAGGALAQYGGAGYGGAGYGDAGYGGAGNGSMAMSSKSAMSMPKSSSTMTHAATAVMAISMSTSHSLSTSTMMTMATTSAKPVAQVSVQVVSVSNNNGSLYYYPDDIKAAPGTLVQFQFHIVNHTVTQSTFDQPCIPIQKTMPNVTGLKSGFMPVAANSIMPVFTVLINDTKPIWLYCGQTSPVNHCQKGMVAVINAPANSTKTLAAFKALAMKTNTMTNATTTATQNATTTMTSGIVKATTNAAPQDNVVSSAGVVGLFISGLFVLLL